MKTNRMPVTPGMHLAEQLKALNMSAAELGRQLGVPTNRITTILNGQRSITGDTALRFGHFFGVSPQFWLNLQANHDLRVAEQKAGSIISKLPTLSAHMKNLPRSAGGKGVEKLKKQVKLPPSAKGNSRNTLSEFFAASQISGLGAARARK